MTYKHGTKRIGDGKWSGSVTKTGRTASIPSTKVLNLPRIVAVRLRTPMTMVVVVVVVASTWKGGVKERV
jgi:hypothetical protein